jgi:mRNA interferase YafQ
LAKAKAKPQAPEPPPPPLTLEFTTQFQKDAKRQEKRGKAMAKLRTVVETLRTRGPLETRHANHPLSGQWEGAWDCHIEADWILIYVKTPTVLRLMRTGSHSDLFQ